MHRTREPRSAPASAPPEGLAALVAARATLVARLALVAELARRLVRERDRRGCADPEHERGEDECDPLHVPSISLTRTSFLMAQMLKPELPRRQRVSSAATIR